MRVLGIDLGTTNTVAGIDGSAVRLHRENGRTTLPSVVSFLPNRSAEVGTTARSRRAMDSRNTIFSAKRLIGRRWGDAKTQEFRDRYPFDLVKGRDDTPAFRTRAGLFTATDIASIVLSAIYGEAARLLGEFDSAIITVPAAFGAPQRRATVAAAEGAHLPEVRLVDEPLATAYAYMNVSNPVARAGIYDLGGGTFDFSIVEWTRGMPRLVCSKSDLSLGGDDVDRQLAEWVAGQVLEQYNWDLKNHSEVYGALLLESERAKIRLCFFEETIVELSKVDPDGPAASGELAIRAEVLDRIGEDLVRRTFITCDSVLGDAGLRPQDLDAVFLAGGSTHLVKVREGIESYFGKSGRFELEPTEVVALGATQVA